MSKEVDKALVEAAARMGKPHERVCLRVPVGFANSAAARHADVGE